MSNPYTFGARPGVTAEVYPPVKSIDLDGVDAYIPIDRVATEGLCDWQTKAFTIGIWFKTAKTSAAWLWSFGDAANANTYFGIRVQLNEVKLFAQDAGVDLFGSGQLAIANTDPGGINPSDDSWHHVAFVHAGTASTTGAVEVWIDGTRAGVDDTTAEAFDPTTFVIGVLSRQDHASRVQFVDGLVSNFQVYGYAADSSQIATMATAPCLDVSRFDPSYWHWLGPKDAFPEMRDHGYQGAAGTLTNGLEADIVEGGPS